MSVQISIDQASLDHLNKQFDILKEQGGRTLYNAMIKILFKIKTNAQLRLRGQRHIVTSRLRNSIYVQAKDQSKVQGPENEATFTDNTGKTWDSKLKTVNLNDMELAVGSNVEYAEKIELLDSYLYWGMRNVDVERTLKDEMRDFMKFGAGVNE